MWTTCRKPQLVLTLQLWYQLLYICCSHILPHNCIHLNLHPNITNLLYQNCTVRRTSGVRLCARYCWHYLTETSVCCATCWGSCGITSSMARGPSATTWLLVELLLCLFPCLSIEKWNRAEGLTFFSSWWASWFMSAVTSCRNGEYRTCLAIVVVGLL